MGWKKNGIGHTLPTGERIKQNRVCKDMMINMVLIDFYRSRVLIHVKFVWLQSDDHSVIGRAVFPSLYRYVGAEESA